MGLTITQFVLGDNLTLAAVSTDNKKPGGQYLLSIWQMEKKSKKIVEISAEKDLEIECHDKSAYNGKILGLNIDRNFITVAVVPATEDEENVKVVEFRFIDASSLVVVFCMMIELDDIIVASGNGLLVFLNKKGSIR